MHTTAKADVESKDTSNLPAASLPCQRPNGAGAQTLAVQLYDRISRAGQLWQQVASQVDTDIQDGRVFFGCDLRAAVAEVTSDLLKISCQHGLCRSLASGGRMGIICCNNTDPTALGNYHVSTRLEGLGQCFPIYPGIAARPLI